MLWKQLIDKKMSTAELCNAVTIAPNTMTKLRRDKVVALPILDRICETLGADYGDIVEHTNGGK